MNDEQTEKRIEDRLQRSGKHAPRVHPQDLDAAIDPQVPVQYYVFPGSAVTVCLLTLKNGFQVTGESAAVSVSNFDAAIAREVALEDARNKLWPLLGFLLKDRLAYAPSAVTAAY